MLRLQRRARGYKVQAKDWNELVDRVNSTSKTILGKGGVKVQNSEKGIVISLAGRSYQMTNEPAVTTRVVNVDDTNDIPVFGCAGVVGQVDDAAGNYDWERILEVREPLARDAQNFVIASAKIYKVFTDGNTTDWSLGGVCWCAGVCAVSLVRWFATDQDDVILSRADCYAGQTYALANVDGPLQILWEEDFVGQSVHLAVVRWVDPKHEALLYENEAATTIPFACPCIPDRTNYATGLSGDKLALISPDTDAPLMVYVNIGGAVAQNGIGRAFYPMGPFLGRVNAAVSVGDPVGAETGVTTFRKDSFGFRVAAYLGQYDSKYWAILVRDTALPLLKATSDPTGDLQNVQTVDEDDSASGHDITVNVPGS